MRLTHRSAARPVEILLVFGVAFACSSDPAPGEGSAATGGKPSSHATGGSRAGSGGGGGGIDGGGQSAGGAGGTPAASGGAGGSSTGGSVGAATGGTAGTPMGGSTGNAPDANPGTLPTDVAVVVEDAGATPMGSDAGPQPSYEGAIPIHYGPEVGPIVQMNCPEDPTVGWTEYKDAFVVQRPHNRPINTRFSIKDGIYNFWVFPNDAPHSPTANGRNPRTEARYGHLADVATGKNFQTGERLYSADMLIERNAVGSAIMQIHTTADGGGPIGLRIQGNGNMVNNGSLTVVQGSTVPGGLVDKWFNFKASFNAATLEVKIYINNCLKSTYKGPRGDGNFYYKNGVYFCKTSQNGCFSHYKNIHLYKK